MARKNYVSLFNATIVFLNIFFGGCLNYGHIVPTVSKFCIALCTKPLNIKKGLENKIDLMFFQVEKPLHSGAQYYVVKRLKG